jgi:hypothetical protein
MLIPFGIFSASAVGSDYELIETQILGSAVASVTFSNLATYASIYEHLQIRAVAKTNFAGSWADTMNIRLNSDTAANYSAHNLNGDGTSVSSSSSTSATSMGLTLIAGNATSTIFGPIVVDIVDAYSTTKNKTIRSLQGTYSAGFQVRLVSGSWRNTASITTIGMTSANSSNFLTGSRFSLYGIKG